jgi:phage shock protein PspC (stress-responsive transcriptional regulator)
MDSGQSAFWESVRSLRKSSTDKKIAGVCGGLGEHTPMPAWLWRALFLALTFLWGTGLVAYIALWLCMPAADQPPNPS